MNFRHDGFDVWVFRRRPAGVEYLVLRASRDKADRWFGGSTFWQVPSDFTGAEEVVPAIQRELDRHGLVPTSVWAAEHTYTIYNRRYDGIVHLAVFAAECDADAITLDGGHSDYRWLPGDDAAACVTFRGLKDGLHWVRHYVTERASPLPELKLA